MYIVFISIIGDGGNQIEAKIDRPFVLPGTLNYPKKNQASICTNRGIVPI